MNTPNPATGPPHSALHFGKRLLDPNTPRFSFFARYNPANPLIASERGDVFPQCKNLRVFENRCSKVFRKCMYGAARDSCCHGDIVSNLACGYAVYTYSIPI